MEQIHDIIARHFPSATVFPLTNKKTPAIPKGTSWKGYDQPLAPTVTAYGISLGSINAVALDLDRHHKVTEGEVLDGVEEFRSFARAHGPVPDTFTVATPSGGCHLYFLLPPGVEMGNKTGVLPPSIDVRGGSGNKGYVVGPGSRALKKVNGQLTDELGTYRIVKDVPMAEMPTWLVMAILSEKPTPEPTPSTPVDYDLLGGGMVKWERDALAEACVRISTLPPGSRNEPMRDEAYKLGAKLGAHRTNEVVPSLVSAGIASGHDKRSVESTIPRAFAAGSAHFTPRPSQLSQSQEPAASAPAAVTDAQDAPTTDTTYHDPYLDIPLARRFADENEYLRFVAEWKSWVLYADSVGVWQIVTPEKVIASVDEWLNKLYLEAVAGLDITIIRKAARCLQASTVTAVEKLARSHRLLDASELDAQNDLLVVKNGVVDLPTGNLLPFDPNYLITKRVDVDYKPEASSWVFDKVLDSVAPDAHSWLQLMAGQALTGHQPSSTFALFMVGEGANGKSGFINSMKATAGQYGGVPPQSTLMRSSHGGDDFGLVEFRGLRQALVEELPDERYLDAGAIKRLVGTEYMTARGIRQAHQTFAVQATLWVTCNRLPSVSETDNGTWRRLLVLPFPYTYRKTQREVLAPTDRLADPRVLVLAGTDQDAREAALAWRIEGARRWYATNKLETDVPPSVVTATAKWQARSDNILGWMDDSLVFDPAHFCLAEDLRDSHNAWLRAHGYQALGHKTFMERFEAHREFQARNLEAKRGRTTGLQQSQWTNPVGESRVAGATPTHVRGVRFRTRADEAADLAAAYAAEPPTVPDDASDLEDLDPFDDNELFDLDDEPAF